MIIQTIKNFALYEALMIIQVRNNALLSEWLNKKNIALFNDYSNNKNCIVLIIQ